MSEIELYTDGGNRNTGNVAGGSVRPTDKSAWAALLRFGEHEKLLSGADYGRTNNYMEIKAVIEGLSAITNPEVKTTVFADSAYVINTMQQKWYVKWRDNNWMKGEKPVPNAELWQALLAQVARFSDLAFVKVKGHSNNKDNNRVDAALNAAMDNLPSK